MLQEASTRINWDLNVYNLKMPLTGSNKIYYSKYIMLRIEVYVLPGYSNIQQAFLKGY